MKRIQIEIPDMRFDTLNKLYDMECEFANRYHWNMPSRSEYISAYMIRLIDSEKMDVCMKELAWSIDNMGK